MSTAPTTDAIPLVADDRRPGITAIGVDVGGSGIKGGAVDTTTGELRTSRVKFDTPEGGGVDAIADTVDRVVEAVRDELPDLGIVPIGLCVPAIVKHGVTLSAANIAKDWIGRDAAAMFSERLGRRVSVINDADAAGVAEDRFGAARDESGSVIVTTLGTGIGTALIHAGELFPNSELGHIELDGHPDYERFASAKIRKREGLGYEEWAARLTPFYRKLEELFAPDLFVVSGGVSKHAERFVPHIDVDTPIAVAELRNNAGIVGAALLGAGGWD